MKLRGKVALVTGSSRGIGRAIAERLARDGALVAVHYGSSADAAATVVKQITASDGKAFAVKGELSSVADIEKLFQSLDGELTKHTKSTRFDILVNNAALDENVAIDKMTEAQFDKQFDVNVKGTFFVTQHAMKRLNDGGRIINISSGASRLAYPASSAYAMTKGAVNNLTLSLAQLLGPRSITVNTLAPGVTSTDMSRELLEGDFGKFIKERTALGRIGQVGDIADVAAFLASDDSRWLTAQYIEASGGLLI